MTIAKLADLVAVADIGEIADLTGQTTAQVTADLATATPTTAAKELAWADQQIYSLIGDKLTDLTAPIPPLLVSIGADLARWRLYKQSAPDHITERKNMGLKALQDCRAGKQTLGLDLTATKVQPINSSVTTNAKTRLFTADNMSRY